MIIFSEIVYVSVHRKKSHFIGFTSLGIAILSKNKVEIENFWVLLRVKKLAKKSTILKKKMMKSKAQNFCGSSQKLKAKFLFFSTLIWLLVIFWRICVSQVELIYNFDSFDLKEFLYFNFASLCLKFQVNGYFLTFYSFHFKCSYLDLCDL